jgi:hypothetical protein
MNSSFHRRRAVAGALVVALVAGAWLGVSGAWAHGRAASAGSPSDARSVRRAGPDAVGIAHCTFRDPTRTTYDYATRQMLAGRVLVAGIRYPALVEDDTRRGAAPVVAGADPDRRIWPFPTIFFAPGYDVDPNDYAPLLDAWVRAGFVVVGVRFPDTNPAAVATAERADPDADPEEDIVNQPADVAFVVRQVVAASHRRSASCGVLGGLVDASEMGVAGQSDGGNTVAMLLYDQGAGYAGMGAGLGLRAAAVMSGSEEGFTGPYEATPGDPPLLVVQSSADECNPPEESAELYDAIGQDDKWFLDLFHGAHLPPYDGADKAGFEVVSSVTTRFFLLELRGGSPAAGFVSYGDRWPLVASLSAGGSAPPMPSLPFVKASCYES